MTCEADLDYLAKTYHSNNNNNIMKENRNKIKTSINWKSTPSSVQCESENEPEIEKATTLTGKINDRLRFIVRNRTAITKTVS
jgi:hypothetical protein